MKCAPARSGSHARERVRGVDVFPHLGDAPTAESIEEVVVVQVVVAACGASLHVRVHGDMVTLGDHLIDRPVRLAEEGVGITEQFDNRFLA